MGEIDNPDYVEVKDVYLRGDIEYIGMEIWQVKAGTIFDNMLVTDDMELAMEKRDAAMELLKEEADAKAAWEEEQKPATDKNDDEDEDEEEADEEDLDFEELEE